MASPISSAFRGFCSVCPFSCSNTVPDHRLTSFSPSYPMPCTKGGGGGGGGLAQSPKSRALSALQTNLADAHGFPGLFKIFATKDPAQLQQTTNFQSKLVTCDGRTPLKLGNLTQESCVASPPFPSPCPPQSFTTTEETEEPNLSA